MIQETVSSATAVPSQSSGGGAVFSANDIRAIEAADLSAGKLLGQLLTGFFALLIALMIVCNFWTYKNLPPNSDPQSGLPSSTETAPK